MYTELLYHLCRLFGSQVKSASSYWIITHVNFTSIFNRTCEASDYEYWNMSDGVNNQSLNYVYNVNGCDSVLKTSSACWVKLGLLNVANLKCAVGIVDNMNE